MILGLLDPKLSGSKIKEVVHDVFRKPLTLFGIKLKKQQSHR